MTAFWVASIMIGAFDAVMVPALVTEAATESWIVLRAMAMPIETEVPLPLEKLPAIDAAPSMELICAVSLAVTLRPVDPVVIDAVLETVAVICCAILFSV